MKNFNHSCTRTKDIGIAWYFRWLTISIAVAPGVALSDENSYALSLYSAYAVESVTVSGLSGLDWCDGKLLTIDDRDDSNIYQIELDAGKARLVEAIQVDIPSRTESPPFLRRLLSFVRGIMGRGTFDWEGISCGNGNISLLSEIDGAVLQLRAEDEGTWRYSGYIPQLQREGLYKKTSIGSEALTWVDDTTLLLGHERSPPALIELNTATNIIAVHNLSEEPETSLQQSKSPDITGMDLHDGLLYTLHRNAMLVCVRTIASYKVLDCRSYRDTEQDSYHKYDNMRYGRAEGIAVNDAYIYMVLDNNGDARVRDGSLQPLFFVFLNPWDTTADEKRAGVSSLR